MQAPSIQSTSKSLVPLGFQSIVDSIMMEAAEKCEEINVKCDEEYRILRRREISEQGEIIEKADRKKRGNVLRDDRVCYTKLVNSFRLAQLKAKNDIFHDILKEAKQRLAADDSRNLQRLIENSLTQAMYMLMEPEVFITCRKGDQRMISSCFASAALTYKKNTKLSVTISFAKHTLPDNSFIGGMVVANKGNTISVKCSLDFRVDDVCRLAMPMIVEMLFLGFGINESPLSAQQAMIPRNAAAEEPVSIEEQLEQNFRAYSRSPEALELQQERLGIGTSSINIHSPPEIQVRSGEQEVREEPQSSPGRTSMADTPSPSLPPDHGTQQATSKSSSPEDASQYMKKRISSNAPKRSLSPDNANPSRNRISSVEADVSQNKGLSAENADPNPSKSPAPEDMDMSRNKSISPENAIPNPNKSPSPEDANVGQNRSISPEEAEPNPLKSPSLEDAKRNKKKKRSPEDANQNPASSSSPEKRKSPRKK